MFPGGKAKKSSEIVKRLRSQSSMLTKLKSNNLKRKQILDHNAKLTNNKKEKKKTMKYIEDMNEWDALMETSKDKLVVVDFTASW